MVERIYNFSPGPAVLPLDALERISENMLSYRNSGLGVMELSHRGPLFEEIIEMAERRFRSLLGISDDYAVLFMTGGATHQFSVVPMNLLHPGKIASYIITGTWAKKALKEAGKFGDCHVAGTSEENEFRSLPDKIESAAGAAYVHFTSNNTLFGTQFKAEPEVNVPLVCDASSDLMCRPLDVSKYGLIYAGAQKNLGIAGVTLVIIRRDLLQDVAPNLPIMLDYRTYADSCSLYNTPPTFPVYVFGEVLKSVEAAGGLPALEERNNRKAALLYDQLDSSDFYIPYADQDCRSIMNVNFSLASEAFESLFLKEAEAAGFSGLKGHRSVGGLRASIYNAFPEEGVQALCSFMADFEKRHGG